jgi:hypothetical protein
MKITKSQLKLIIKEELEKVLEAEHDAEPSMKDRYMEVVDNLYRSYGEEMEEDVESALQGIPDDEPGRTKLAYVIFTVVKRLPKPATSTHDQAVDILKDIKAEGGINGLFRQGLEAAEEKGKK